MKKTSMHYLVFFFFKEFQPITFFFFKEFQLITSAPNDSFLSSDEDTNWF